LFASYEAQGHADRQSFDAYEAAMDNLSEGVDKLATEIRHRSATDNIVARQRLDHVLLAVAAIAAALAITMGAIFGIRLTRPLVQLRDAAVRLGGGDFDFSADATSNDELGQLTREFAQMAQSIRRLLATVAEQKTRLENVFSSLAEMLLVCGPDGLILTANRAVCSTLGYREEELAGRALDSIIASAKFPELRETAGRHSVSGALHDRDGDQQLQKRDGRYSPSHYPFPSCRRQA